MNPAGLLRDVAACGFRVVVECGELPTLVRTRPRAQLPPDLMAALKRHRAAVVAYLTECEVCGRDVSDDEDRERLKDAAFCTEGGSKAVTDGNGVFHPATYRCPYKE